MVTPDPNKTNAGIVSSDRRRKTFAVLKELTKINWVSFKSIAGALALIAAIVGVGIWKGDWRAEQIHREKTDTISQLRSEIVKDNNINARLQIELESKSVLIEQNKDKLAASNAQIDRLRHELTASESNVIQEKQVFSRDLDQLKASTRDAERQIQRLQASLQKITEERDDLRRIVNERRPLLRFSVDESVVPSKFIILAQNPTDVVLRVIQSHGRSWANGRPGTAIYTEPIAIFPGNTHSIYTFNVSGDLLLSLRQGKSDYRAAFCFIYETTSLADRRRWLNEAWFTYQPKDSNGHNVSFVKQDDRSIEVGPDSCNFERRMPHAWLDFKADQ
jgi:hypothetical protein